MPTHKSNDYKLSAVKYYLSHSKNQVHTCKIFGCSERSLMRWVNKYKSTNHITRKKRGLTYNELVNNVKGVLHEIPTHIYKILIKGAYDRNEKNVKLPSTRKRKPKKYLD
jgi:transposase-like protein